MKGNRRVIDANCPTCDYRVDDSTGIGDAEGQYPEPTNFAVCINCAGLAVYYLREEGTLGLRPLTEEEQATMDKDLEVTKMRAMILARGALR